MVKRPIFAKRVLVLPPDYAVWVQAAANYARCSPEDVVCLALREWVRLPHRVDFARDVSRSIRAPQGPQKAAVSRSAAKIDPVVILGRSGPPEGR